MARLRRASAPIPFLAFAALALGAGTSVGAPAPGHPVRLTTIDAAPAEATLISLAADGARLAGREAPVPLDAIVEVRFAAGAAPAAPPPEAVALRLALRGGDVVRGTFVSGDENSIVVRPLGLPDLAIPFDAVRRIETETPDRGPCDEPGRLRPARPGTDVAWARSGDAFAGTLARATPDGVVLEDGGDERTVAWTDLVVLHVDEPDLPPAQGLLAEAETLGGSLWSGTLHGYDGVALRMATRSGLEVSVPRDALVALRLSGGRFVYASDLPFVSKFTPYYADDALDPGWLERWYGARADRTPSGCPLRIGGVAYRHGIAVHARSVVTVPLGKAFSRFSAAFGIDDEALAAPDGPRGDVTARVLADGREVWTSGGSVRGGEAARAVGPLDVTGVEALVLEVDFGGDQHRMDRADWADPLLVRAR